MAAVMTRSALVSASVTRSKAPVLVWTIPSSSRRKRGRISCCAACLRIAARRSIFMGSRVLGLDGEACEVEQARVEHVAGIDIAERADHDVLAPGHCLLHVGQHGLGDIALQAILRAAEIARNDRE